MTLSEFILTGKEKLAQAKIQCADPLLHMKQIAEVALGIDTTQLYLKWEEPLDSNTAKKLEGFLNRRLLGEPFQYIVGFEWFWKSKFEVGPGVLIPRPETEQLVEIILTRMSPHRQKIGELGAGSGNIGISVLLDNPNFEWHAFESGRDALSFLTKNKESLLRQSEKYLIHAGDFFTLSSQFAPYDWVVANPPYVATEEFPSLPSGVKHEPRSALDGGKAGLEVMARLIEKSAEILKKGGYFLTEIGSKQDGAVKKMLSERSFEEPEIMKDDSKLPRVILARKR